MHLHHSELLAATAFLLLGLTATGLQQVRIASRPPPTTVHEIRLDVNQATRGQLTILPGVGPATAGAIVRGRPYGSVEELRPILGAKRFACARPYLALER